MGGGSRAKESRVAELSSFVNGISRDYAAVRAACSLPWSNGIVEGHVNRLKFLKRQFTEVFLLRQKSLIEQACRANEQTSVKDICHLSPIHPVVPSCSACCA